MLLATKPITTSATPNRCGKSFRAYNSRLGQTRHRVICRPTIASFGIAICCSQRAQFSAVDPDGIDARVPWPHPGQLYVTFIGEEKEAKDVAKRPLNYNGYILSADSSSPVSSPMKTPSTAT